MSEGDRETGQNLEGPVVRTEEDLDPAELAELEERRRGPVGLGSRSAHMALMAAALMNPMMEALRAPELNTPVKLVRRRRDETQSYRIDPLPPQTPFDRMTQRWAANAPADPEKKRRRKAERAARKKNRR